MVLIFKSEKEDKSYSAILWSEVCFSVNRKAEFRIVWQFFARALLQVVGLGFVN